MSPVTDLCLEYGINVHDVFVSLREQGNTLPKLFSKGEELVELQSLPLCRSLKVGETYTFRIKMKSDGDLSLNNHGVSILKQDWTDEGDSVYSLQYMVRDIESLSLGVKGNSNDYWNIVVDYAVDQPSQEDWKKVEEWFPLNTPETRSVKNLFADRWKKAGVDEHKMLGLIREFQVSELPILFSKNGQALTIVSVPMTKNLKSGESYTFSFYPKSGIKWALVNNNNEWFSDWQISDDGMYSMSLTPTVAGPLYLYVQNEEGQSFWSCLQYEVISR